MPSETTDVNKEATSSVATTDVKQTFDQAANALIEGLTKDSSPEPEAKDSDVLKKNTTEKEEPTTESAEAEPDKEVKKEPEDTDKEKAETTKEEEPSDEAKVDETKESPEAKHEDAIPYARFKEVNDKASRFEGLAKDHESLITYCQQNNIPPDQFRGTLETLALASTNPLEAIKRTEAFLEQLKVSAGTGLPSDLQKEVNEAKEEFESGNISKERLATIESRMKELAKARHQHTSAEQQNRFAQMQQQQAQQQEFLGALSAWAGTKVKLDPSFKPTNDPKKPGKFEDFMMKNQELWIAKPPQTISEAVSYADQALDYVNKMIQRYQPAPKVKKAPLSSVHSRSTESEQPKTMDDVVNRVAKKHGYSV